MSQTISTLVSRTVSGDSDAYEQLIISHNSLILWLIRHHTDGSEDAEDIRQEVVIRIFRHLGSLKRPEAFGSWMRSIVFRECMRYLASKKLHVSIETLPEPENLFIDTDLDSLPCKHMERLELESALASEISSLQEPVRNIFHMHYYRGMRCRDIAEAVGMKAGAVSVTLHRVKERLKEKLRV